MSRLCNYVSENTTLSSGNPLSFGNQVFVEDIGFPSTYSLRK